MACSVASSSPTRKVLLHQPEHVRAHGSCYHGHAQGRAQGLLHKALYSAISHAKFAGGGLGLGNKPRSSEDLGLRCSVPDPRIKCSNYKAGGQRNNPGSLSEGTKAPACSGFLRGMVQASANFGGKRTDSYLLVLPCNPANSSMLLFLFLYKNNFTKGYLKI